MTQPSDGDGAAVLVENSSTSVVTITLNRPRALNALNVSLVDELRDALQEADARPETRAVIVTGGGRAFCSGVDLFGYGWPGAAREADRTDARLLVQQDIASLASVIRGMQNPVIAALNGVAVGGGVALALLCDIRVAAETCVLKPAFVQRGLTAGDLGVTWLLPRFVGQAVAAEILLTGRDISTPEALRLGLVSRIVPGEELLHTTQQLGNEIAANAPFGVRRTKRLIWDNAERSFDGALAAENDSQVLASLTSDYREAVLAFREKRPPVFGVRHDRSTP